MNDLCTQQDKLSNFKKQDLINFGQKSLFPCNNVVGCDSRLNMEKVFNGEKEFISRNQKMVGKQNPRTLIPPIIANPIIDFEHWRANPFVVPPGINSAGRENQYDSGYLISNAQATPQQDEIYQEEEFNNPNEGLFTTLLQPNVATTNSIIDPSALNSLVGIGFQPQFQPRKVTLRGNRVHYNNVDPRVGVDHGEIEPLSLDERRETYSPTFNIPFEKNQDRDEEPSLTSIYDPRFSGYGSSDRGYIEPMTGQQRFAYDDVNAVRMPNYICRSNIDFAKWADSYGPLKSGWQNGNPNNKDIRWFADNSFHNATMQFRTDMTDSMMSKNNSVIWQRKMHPKRTL